MTRSVLLAAVVALVSLSSAAEPPHFPPSKSLGPVETYGRHIQRTMTLLATSTPEKRNTVRVLFYGQSITEQDWWKSVADDLRQRFPHANLIIENRAIGGFASQLLVKTAETDLYPFYPDLLIFYVYGSHLEYENIIRRVRERTTAEILMQTDHATNDNDLTEETDPAKLTPKQWTPWMNHAFLPGTARKYGAELVNQHELWKDYLRDQHLPAPQLLKDGVHLNDHGNYLMAEIVKAYLRYDPSFPQDEWQDLVKTYRVGTEVNWQDGRLQLEFEGNRVDVICQAGSAPPAAVRIDGRRPSEIPELYGLTRTTYYPGLGWPCLLRVTAEKPRQLEEWSLTLTNVSADLKQFRFRVAGSLTGPDGEGSRGERFVSQSGRVVIDPADWNFEYALKIVKQPIQDGFTVRWKVIPHFVDEFVSPGISDLRSETVVTLGQGLANAKHTLEITGSPQTPIAAVRVYRPPLRGSSDAASPQPK
jgi:hypothetical protein